MSKSSQGNTPTKVTKDFKIIILVLKLFGML